jgi:archaellum biogenesis ATPase FlaH
MKTSIIEENTTRTILDFAKEYAARGFSIIPLKKRSKEPAIIWKTYQNRRFDEHSIQYWFGNHSDYNIGIVTGKISGIVVVDLDSEEAVKFSKENNFPITPTVRTGKGYHMYFAYPKDRDVGNFQKRDDLPGIDLRGEGGYVVAPPSIHASGKKYEWMGEGLEIPFAELPQILLADKTNKTPLKELYKGVKEGLRNDSLARIVGSLANDGLNFHECYEVVSSVNAKNNPPLRTKEVVDVVESILEKHQNELSNCLHIENKKSDSDNFDPSTFLKTAAELMKMESVKVEWIIDGLLPKQSITVLHGRGGIGKSWMALLMAKAISNGVLFMGKQTQEASVVYVDFENPPPVVVERVKKMKLNSEKVFFWQNTGGLRPISLDAKEWKNYQKLPHGVLIIDTLRASQSGDENDSRQMALIMNNLKELRDTGFTIILLHHTPKGNDRTYRGSTAISDLADHTLSLHKIKGGSLEEIEDEAVEGRYYLGANGKSRYEKSHLILEWDKEEIFILGKDPDIEDIESIYELLEGKKPLNQSQIFDLVKSELDISGKGKLSRLLKKGEKESYWISHEDKTKGKGIYYFTVPKSSSVSDSSYTPPDSKTVERDTATLPAIASFLTSPATVSYMVNPN